MRLYLGIDPGINGGVACIKGTGKIHKTLKFDKNNYKEKKNILSFVLPTAYYGVDLEVLIEKPHVWNTAKANLTELIRDAGIWEGWCQSQHMHLWMLSPKEWQLPFTSLPTWRMCPVTGVQRKRERGLAMVREVFGDVDVEKHCVGKRGGILDGVCDALLMAKHLQLKKIL